MAGGDPFLGELLVCAQIEPDPKAAIIAPKTQIGLLLFINRFRSHLTTTVRAWLAMKLARLKFKRCKPHAISFYTPDSFTSSP